MSDGTKIEWTDSTWTPIRASRWDDGKFRIGWHCEHASEGCRNCYAEGMNRRLGTGLDFKPGHREDIDIALDEKMLTQPLRWKKPRMIFVNSMTDTFASFVKDEWLDRMFAVMALCPQHTFQVLTKRAERMREYMTHVEREARWMTAVADLFEMLPGLMDRCHPIIGRREPWLPLPNVWLGVSAEDQANWNERKNYLRDTPAAVHFASFEPLLGPIVDDDLATYIQWAIVGGESGPHARPMHPDWARSLRDQCAAADVPYFFKQWGEYTAEIVAGTSVDLRYDLRSNQSVAWGDGKTNHTQYTRVGKKRAGRLLDGIEHNGMPMSPGG